MKDEGKVQSAKVLTDISDSEPLLVIRGLYNKGTRSCAFRRFSWGAIDGNCCVGGRRIFRDLCGDGAHLVRVWAGGVAGVGEISTREWWPEFERPSKTGPAC